MTKKNEETPPKQTELAGVEAKKVKELDDLMEQQNKLGKKAAKLRVEMGENNAKLLELMKKHGLEVYKDTTAVPPLLIRLKAASEKVKVTEIGEDEGDSSETWE